MFSGTPWCCGSPPAGAVEISLEIAVAGSQVLGAAVLPDRQTDQGSDCCNQTELYWVDLDSSDDDDTGSGSEDDPLQQVVEEFLSERLVCQLFSLLLSRCGSDTFWAIG